MIPKEVILSHDTILKKLFMTIKCYTVRKLGTIYGFETFKSLKCRMLNAAANISQMTTGALL